MSLLIKLFIQKTTATKKKKFSNTCTDFTKSRSLKLSSLVLACPKYLLYLSWISYRLNSMEDHLENLIIGNRSLNYTVYYIEGNIFSGIK